MRRMLSVTIAALAVTGAVAADVVERRGSAPPLRGDARTDLAGVEVRSEFGAVHFVPWDRVRDVVTDIRSPALEAQLRRATDLWRARSRVERGDTTLAEPIFERYWETYAGQTHETALVVAEGLLRCRLARGSNASALLPALEVARLRRAGVTTESYAQLPVVFDETMALCPALPPVWVSDRTASRVANEVPSFEPQGDDVIEAIAELYLVAAERQMNQASSPAIDTLQFEHPGVELMHLIVETTATSLEESRGARNILPRRVDGLPPFATAWSHWFVGLSYLRENDRGRQREGLLHIAWLPSKYGTTQPFLTGLALSQLAYELDEQGDAAGASAVRADLVRRYPNHPIRRMPGPPVQRTTP